MRRSYRYLATFRIYIEQRTNLIILLKSFGDERHMVSKNNFSGKVGWDVSMSLDGFITDPHDKPGKIFNWYFSGDTPSKFGGEMDFKLTKDDAEYLDEGIQTVGSIVAGRRTYDVSNAWNGSFFIPVPFFVLTHDPPEHVPEGTTKFTLVTNGIESAINQAKKEAGDRMVGLMGASTARQCFEAGRIDQLRIHISPVMLGDGIRLYDVPGTREIELKKIDALESSSGVIHITYDVIRRNS
jgi:dihydrofolate reductase